MLPFPDWETLPYDLFSPHPDIVSQRLAALYRLPALKRGVLVVPVSDADAAPAAAALRDRRQRASTCKVGQKLDLDAEKRRLEAAGYRNVPQVLDPGDFAVRGALLDLYPMGADEPYRIELFDDAIDSIRSLRSGDAALARQGRVGAAAARRAKSRSTTPALKRALRRSCANASTSTPRRCPLYQDLKEGGAPAGIEYYLPLFFEQTATLFDYLGDDTLLVVGEGVARGRRPRSGRRPATATNSAATTSNARCCRRRRSVLPPDALRERLNQRPRASRSARAEHPQCATARSASATQPAPVLPLDRPRTRSPAAALKSFLANYPGRVLVAADSAGPARGADRAAARPPALQPRTRRRLAGVPRAGDDALRHRRGAAGRRLRARPSRRWRCSPNASCSPSAPTQTAPPQARRARTRSDHPRPRRDRPKARRSCTRTTASAATAA